MFYYTTEPETNNVFFFLSIACLIGARRPGRDVGKIVIFNVIGHGISKKQYHPVFPLRLYGWRHKHGIVNTIDQYIAQ